MTEKHGSLGWAEVDKNQEPDEFAQYLDAARRLPSVRAYKRRSFELARLTPGAAVLDVGCGTGDDTIGLLEHVGPGGRAVGVDFSQAMIDVARRRWADRAPAARFEAGDILDLQFADDSFDAVRADRVLQHLEVPVKAAQELRRVTRPGGRVVLCDTDWGTYLFDLTPSPAARRLHDFVSSLNASPWSGRQLYGLLGEVGCVDRSVEAHISLFLSLEQLEQVGQITPLIQMARGAGVLSSEEAAGLSAELRQRDEEGRLFASLTLYIAAGTLLP